MLALVFLELDQLRAVEQLVAANQHTDASLTEALARLRDAADVIAARGLCPGCGHDQHGPTCQFGCSCKDDRSLL